jgi:hypothetical protein
MTKISPSLFELLTAAAKAPGGTTLATHEALSVIKVLITRGMLIAIPQPHGPSQLMITEAGRAAIAPRATGVRTIPEIDTDTQINTACTDSGDTSNAN